MRYLITLLLIAVTIVLYAQDRDGNRMKKDIEVAEKVIAASLETSYDKEGLRFSVEGSYLDGYGVLFTLRQTYSPVVWGATSTGNSTGCTSPTAPPGRLPHRRMCVHLKPLRSLIWTPWHSTWASSKRL